MRTQRCFCSDLFVLQRDDHSTNDKNVTIRATHKTTAYAVKLPTYRQTTVRIFRESWNKFSYLPPSKIAESKQ
jgi:hypothetical protein